MYRGFVEERVEMFNNVGAAVTCESARQVVLMAAGGGVELRLIAAGRRSAFGFQASVSGNQLRHTYGFEAK